MEIIFNHIRKEKKKEYLEALDRWCEAKEKMSNCVNRVMQTCETDSSICQELTLAAREERALWQRLGEKEYMYKHEPRIIIKI